MNLFILLAIFIIMSVIGLTLLAKNLNCDYGIIVTLILLIVLIGFGGEFYIISVLLADYFKVSRASEPLYTVATVIPLLFIQMSYFKFLMTKTQIPYKESKLIPKLEKYKLWKNNKFQNIISILILISSLCFFVSLGVSPATETRSGVEEVQLMGIKYNPAYIDDRGTEFDEYYEFKLVYTKRNQSSTINSDNHDKEKLKEYYEVFKHNFEGLFKANVKITEYKDGVEFYSIEDIILE